MTANKLAPRPIVHHCPVCQFPQTKIRRSLGDDRQGSTNYVCTRVQCAVGFDLTKVDTWKAV